MKLIVQPLNEDDCLKKGSYKLILQNLQVQFCSQLK